MATISMGPSVSAVPDTETRIGDALSGSVNGAGVDLSEVQREVSQLQLTENLGIISNNSVVQEREISLDRANQVLGLQREAVLLVGAEKALSVVEISINSGKTIAEVAATFNDPPKELEKDNSGSLWQGLVNIVAIGRSTLSEVKNAFTKIYEVVKDEGVTAQLTKVAVSAGRAVSEIKQDLTDIVTKLSKLPDRLLEISGGMNDRIVAAHLLKIEISQDAARDKVLESYQRFLESTRDKKTAVELTKLAFTSNHTDAEVLQAFESVSDLSRRRTDQIRLTTLQLNRSEGQEDIADIYSRISKASSHLGVVISLTEIAAATGQSAEHVLERFTQMVELEKERSNWLQRHALPPELYLHTGAVILTSLNLEEGYSTKSIADTYSFFTSKELPFYEAVRAVRLSTLPDRASHTDLLPEGDSGNDTGHPDVGPEDGIFLGEPESLGAIAQRPPGNVFSRYRNVA